MKALYKFCPFQFGYLGFLGFLGFSYYSAPMQSSALLLFFALFGLFGCFFVQNVNIGILALGEEGRLLAEKKDERYLRNRQKSMRNAFFCSLIQLSVLCIFASATHLTQVQLVLLCAFGIVAISLTYCISFYCLEKR